MNQLFGGAIVCSLPPTYSGLSELRNIPDNQELYADAETDSVFVVEILEYTAHVKDEDIAQHCFEDIKDGNEAKTALVEESGIIDNFFVCNGVQTGVVKAHEQDPEGNDIRVWVGVLRLKDYNADVVLSVTSPIKISQESSSFGVVPNVERGKEVFVNALKSFKIVNYGLFAT